jgi:hypothetical protein
LPDGNPNFDYFGSPWSDKFWYILKPVGIFCQRLVYFVSIWYSLRAFGIFCGILCYFPRFGVLHQEKSGNPE